MDIKLNNQTCTQAPAERLHASAEHLHLSVAPERRT
jgi:hypothetical protein